MNHEIIPPKKTLNYVIATYAGISAIRGRDNQAESNLHTHMSELAKVCSISTVKPDQITIVIAKCNGAKYDNYYRFEEWKKLFPDVIIIALEFEFSDLYSYGQWLWAYKNFNNFDYYIVMEDDYVCFKPNFVQILISLFQQKFKTPLGYLGTYVSNLGGNPENRHCAISNGIISRESFHVLGNQEIEQFRKILGPKFCGGDCQLYFCKMLALHSVPMDDFSREYKALYWSYSVVNYSDYSVSDILIVPVQYIYQII